MEKKNYKKDFIIILCANNIKINIILLIKIITFYTKLTIIKVRESNFQKLF